MHKIFKSNCFYLKPFPVVLGIFDRVDLLPLWNSEAFLDVVLHLKRVGLQEDGIANLKKIIL